MKTAAKKGSPALSTARRKKARVESEYALVQATAKVPAILGMADDQSEATEVPANAESSALAETGIPDEAKVISREDVNDQIFNDEDADDEGRESGDEGLEAVAMAVTTDESEALPVDDLAKETKAEPASIGASDSGSRVLESPLAKRMREQAGQGKPRRKRGLKTGAEKQDLGPEFAQADAEARSIKAQINTFAAEVRGAVDQEITTQMSQLRKELRALRQKKKAALEAAGGERLQAMREKLAEARARRDLARDSAIAARREVVAEPEPSEQETLEPTVPTPINMTPINMTPTADEARGAESDS